MGFFLALPVLVGLAELLEAGTEEATEDEDMAAELGWLRLPISWKRSSC